MHVASGPDSYLQHAAELLASLSPSVAIVTLGVPYRQRWEELRALQRSLPDCRFIVATTDSRMMKTERLRDGRGTVVLGMPFDVDDLLSVVRYALVSNFMGSHSGQAVAG